MRYKEVFLISIVLILLSLPLLLFSADNPVLVNIGLGKNLVASGQYSPVYNALKASDGEINTAWGSPLSNDPQWIYINLQSIQTVNGLGLKWYNQYYPKLYEVYLSNDRVNWSKAASLTKNSAGFDIFTFNINITIQYIAVYILTKNSSVVGLSEFEVYQYQNIPTPTPPEKFLMAKTFMYDGNVDKMVNQCSSMNVSYTMLMARDNTDCIEITKLQNRGINTFAIVQNFYYDGMKDYQSALKIDGTPAKESWLTMACPSNEDFRNKRIDWIKTVVSVSEPYGISLDFCRYFVFWENVNIKTGTLGSLPQTCFCSGCISKFETRYNLTVPDNNWILNNHYDKWTEFKCDVISSYVKRVYNEINMIKPGIKLALHVVPWEDGQLGGALKKIAAQNLNIFSNYADILIPMTYTGMTQQNEIDIQYLVDDIRSQTGNYSWIVPTIHSGDKISNYEYFCNTVLGSADGIAPWPWESLTPIEENALTNLFNSY